ncbi:MAG: GNAT family N-acetyltransferase [Planctomycetes bacterium]|nr:GNAT family N-acetyltransferase [Planctomycetota bacterium]
MATVRHIQGEAELRKLVDPAARASNGAGDTSVGCPTDPVVVSLHRVLISFCGMGDRLGAFALRGSDGLTGLMPYLLQSYPLPCRIGEVCLFRAPLRRLRLLHEFGHWPDAPAKYDDLLAKVAEVVSGEPKPGGGPSGVDLVWATALPVESVLARIVTGRRGRGGGFVRYQSTQATPHHRIRLTETFEAYLADMSPKTRSALRRKTRNLLGDVASEHPKVQEPGEIARQAQPFTGLVRITGPDDVPWLVEHLTELSRKTYQYNLLGLGVRDPEQLAGDALAAARRGELRCYVLLVAGTALAFMYGTQRAAVIDGSSHGDVYDYIDVGHDPAWSDRSPGTVLQYLVIQDLCGHHRPALFDFGPGDAVHKARFGNESYLERDLYLFCPTARAVWARNAHRVCTRTSSVLGSMLRGLGLKTRIRRLVRRVGSLRISRVWSPGS